MGSAIVTQAHRDLWPTMSQVNEGQNPHLHIDPGVKYKGLTPTHNRAMCVIDTEFTGFPVTKAVTVDVCAIKTRSNGIQEIFDEKLAISHATVEEYRRRGQSKWEEVVGFSEAEWADARPASDVIREFFEFVQGCAWVSWGDADVKHWSAVFAREHIAFTPLTCFPLICGEYLTRKFLPGLKSYKLSAVCEHFGLPPEQEHRARGGAELCQQILELLMSPKR